VKAGGKLLLSVQDPQDVAALSELTRDLGISLALTENKDFKNGELASFDIHDGPLANPKETYLTYSNFYLTNPLHPGSGYFNYKKVGKGEVFSFVGLGPFSNILIAKKDNSELAIRMAKSFPSITFDEYHHFFSDRSFFDLLKDPAFGATIAGIVATLILFFFFGHTPLHEKHLIPPPRKRPVSFHEFSEKFLRSTIERKGSFEETLAEHYRLLSRLYPDVQPEIENQRLTQVRKLGAQPMKRPQFLKAIEELVHFHAEILKRKGRLIS
jgi:hypothetical protein